MRRYRFLLAPGAPPAVGEWRPLAPGEGRHAHDVLRLGAGAAIDALDAAGGRVFAATLEPAPPEERTAGVTWGARLGAPHAEDTESPARLVLAPALLKADAFEWLLEKATELGVARIVPVVAERSVVRVDMAALPKKLERWRRIVLAAAKQSERTRPPEVDAPVGLEAIGSPEGGESGGGAGLVVMLAERGRGVRGVGAAVGASRQEGAARGVTLLVGPEGGWAEKEFDLARRRGWTLATMGARVLRAETAALAALALAQGALGDLDP